MQFRQWPQCACSPAEPVHPLAISGPLWLGPLQHSPTLTAMQAEADRLSTSRIAPSSRRLLVKLLLDPGIPARCWATAELGRRLGGGPPAMDSLLQALHSQGYVAVRSGVMDGMFRCNAPWPRVVELAAALNR